VIKLVKPRTPLDGIEICEHGGKSESERDKQGEVIDFSVNLNPYGPPDFVFDAIKEARAEINLYPDTECNELREKISRKFGCQEEEVLIGAGVSELIQLVALSFVKNRALMLHHTYGEYETAAKMMGAEVKHIPMPSLRIHPELIAEEMEKDDVIFLCNPNNPTGQYLGKREIEEIIEEAERVEALLVIDEAYVDFVENAIAFPSHNIISGQNLIVLRSLTKSYAIPGIRIGYAISSMENIREMRKVKVPWSVSVFAQKMGIAAVKDEEFLKKAREKIERNKEKIENRLRDLNMPVQSDVNFYILDVGNAREMKRELLKYGIQVRDCTSFGLPSHIRFCVRREGENERLINALHLVF
jgi:histidinol-phosphate aminotransferase